MTELPIDQGQMLEELFAQVSAFDFRPDVGYAVGLIPRVSRFISGDPVTYKTASSPNFSTPAILPDEPRAKSALCHVVGAGCFYRLDGTAPGSSVEQSLAVGTIFLLTGMPSIKGFIFQAVGIQLCTITVTYFD